MNTRAEATRWGRRQLKRFRGKGWILRVWKNMGWHVAFHNKGLNVHTSRPAFGRTIFYALLSDEGTRMCSGGLAAWSPGHKHYSNPNKAAQAATAAARAYVNHLNTAVTQAENIYAPRKTSRKN